MQKAMRNTLNSAKSLMNSAKSKMFSWFTSRKADNKNPYDFNSARTKQLFTAMSLYGMGTIVALTLILVGNSTPFAFLLGFLFGHGAVNTALTYFTLKKHLKEVEESGVGSVKKKLSKEEQLAEDAENSRKIVEAYQQNTQHKMDSETKMVMDALFDTSPKQEEVVEVGKKDEATDFNSIFKK